MFKHTRNWEWKMCSIYLHFYLFLALISVFFFSIFSHFSQRRPATPCVYILRVHRAEKKRCDFFLGGNFNYFSLFAAWSEFFNSFFCLSRGGIIMVQQIEESRRLSLTAGCAWHIQKSESSRTKVDCTTHQAPRYSCHVTYMAFIPFL